jgi:hypothetical protein
MEYLIPAAIILIAVTAFVTFITLYTTRKGGPGEVDRSAADASDARPGMGADSATDLGDTDQLSQEQTGGETHARGRFERKPGARERTVDAPDSEKLADRSF